MKVVQSEDLLSGLISLVYLNKQYDVWVQYLLTVIKVESMPTREPGGRD